MYLSMTNCRSLACTLSLAYDGELIQGVLFVLRPKVNICSSQIVFTWQCKRFQLITQDVLKITILTDNQSSGGMMSMTQALIKQTNTSREV